MEDHHHEDPITELITTYSELNSSYITELYEEPSPLEFMRFVARNTPFVIRRGAVDWKATQQWSGPFLKSHLGDEPVNVAVTPNGNADAPTLHPKTNTLVFAKPHEEDQPFSDFLPHVRNQEIVSRRPPSEPTSEPFSRHPWDTETRYAQTQNDNLRHEYASLFSYVPPSIPFARIALGIEPEAINLWIGNSSSVTALHKDNYENVYVQIMGQKHFVLLPPHCQPCVNETALKPATYVRKSTHEFELVMDEGADDVPFAIWDPDAPKERATEYSHLAEPMRVTLDEGDMLYLPAMWYHKVSQTGDADGLCVAVNYWYDMDFAGPLYPFSNFVRSVNINNKNNSG